MSWCDKMESKALSLLLFFTSILSAFGTNPGIVVRVNQESLDYGKFVNILLS